MDQTNPQLSVQMFDRTAHGIDYLLERGIQACYGLLMLVLCTMCTRDF